MTGVAQPSRGSARQAVFLRSDLFGGCAVILFVSMAGWLAVKSRLPLRIAQCLFVVLTLVGAYLIADALVPEYNRPEWIWALVVSLSIAPIHIGWGSVADAYRSRELAQRYSREDQNRSSDHPD